MNSMSCTNVVRVTNYIKGNYCSGATFYYAQLINENRTDPY